MIMNNNEDMARKLNDDKTNENDALNFVKNGGLIFLITLIFYYVISVSERLSYESIGVPTEFIDFPFYSLVEKTELLILVILPISFFFFTAFIMAYMRFDRHKNGDLPSDPFKDERKKIYARSFYSFLFGFFFLPATFFYATFAPKIDYIIPTFIITGFVFIFFSIYMLIYTPFFGKTGNLYKEEKLFLTGGRVYASVVIITQVLIAINFSFQQNRPLDIVIMDKVILEGEYYKFNYLVGEKNGSGVWLELAVDRKFDTNKSLEVPVQIGEIINTKEIKNQELRRIRISRELDNVSLKTNFSFADVETAKKYLER